MKDGRLAHTETDEINETMGIIPANELEIKSLIYTVRGMQVMLDSDLAMLYGVETRTLNQAVTRNPKRFPEPFCFRITKEEAEYLTSQIVMLRPELEKRNNHWRHLPRVFSESGVSMLSSVLRSETAINVSVQIIKSFVEMRHFIANNAVMFDQIRSVELRQLEYQKSTDERFERVFDYMESHKTPNQKVFFDGQIYDAFELIISLIQKAKSTIALVDGYVDTSTLNILAKKVDGVEVTVWTQPGASITQFDLATFNAQYPLLSIKRTTNFHDRFLILDEKEGYHIGASLKDAGKKTFAMTRIEDESSICNILARLNTCSASLFT